ncbi:BLUF domain-containing protein [Maribacter sp. 2210JD10-5]|uniref:BLUF domain-containing protein n=1 Tax=Maribacter sp. 2210JD10-5 TaxID=3386272 RepID=UPI0039BC6929
MYSLIYRSVANDSFDLPQIYSMLGDSNEYNAEHGITGCLLYHRNQFLQLLEGEKNEVQKLFNKISKDDRHHEVQEIEKEYSTKRLFNKWSMAFYDYGQNELSAQLKMGQIDSFFNTSNVFHHKSDLVLPFFSTVREILFPR